jgi:hypothetical protein
LAAASKIILAAVKSVPSAESAAAIAIVSIVKIAIFVVAAFAVVFISKPVLHFVL